MADEIAWFAGYFEGEGSIFLQSSKSGNARYLRMSVGSTDEDVLRHVQDVVGGAVSGPFPTRSPRGAAGKDIFHWTLTRTEEVRTLALAILPYMGERRSADICRCLQEQHYADRPTEEERLWRLIDKTPTCWLWMGFKDPYGFATWQVTQGKRVQVHRHVMDLLQADVPLRLVNTCGNKHCVKPDHWANSKSNHGSLRAVG